MAQHIKGIIANIGDDAESFSSDQHIVTMKYPERISWKDDKDATEVRTMFSKKDVHIYVPNADGGTSKIQKQDLPPQEYIFEAMVIKLGPNLAKATDIIVTNVKK
jgi:hypothetical protein